jgi:hypothetical protein
MADWKIVRYDPTYAEPLDPEIIPLCDALNNAGFVTISSCCGHGSDWPRVWFEHSTDNKIENMARFVMSKEAGHFRPFFSMFQKEILMVGYIWLLEIHINDMYANTPPLIGLRMAVKAMDSVAQTINAWHNNE